MSSNKGKDGEMKIVRLSTHIAESEDWFDFTRHTTTNTADMGADIILRHDEKFLEKMQEIADGKSPSEPCEIKSLNLVKSRVDVKTTTKSLQKDTITKFISDTRKHPDCKGHILIGGSDMSNPAKKEFKQAQEVFLKERKNLIYISNDGVKRLENYYQKAPELPEDE